MHLKRKSSCLLAAAALALVASAHPAFAHEPEPIEFSEVGIPYGWFIELGHHESSVTPPDHVGAWSWDEDTFPETTRGWTHTSKWIKLDLTEPSSFTLTLESRADVPWPSGAEPNRVAGTNLFPSFTLYKGWDTDGGVPLDQDHTFNNRGDIEWAEDVTYLDHLENATGHLASRTWILPAGHYTLNLGGNSPATVAEGRQGYKATLTAVPAAVEVTNAVLSAIPFSEIGIPYGIGLVLDDSSSAESVPDHVGAWSWDEDTFPETTRGWTHTSMWVKLNLLKPAKFSLTLSNLANVPWPSGGEPNRLAGTNLFPSFSLYREWDTDAGDPLDQNHTFNNRGNIEWAEDAVYLDHLENTNEHSITRTWTLAAGHYTINLGGNSPAVVAEGRQGYKAFFQTAPLTVPATNALVSSLPFSEIGIPYGLGITLGDASYVETEPDHVGAWSWDEDTFPETTRGWTHTSKFLKVALLQPAKFTLVLSNLANVPWPSGGEPDRVAGTNLFPSFTLYQGWDTDAGDPMDQDHTFNNRGNIEWAEDTAYLDHLENTNSHTSTRTWILPSGRYTINLGGNSPAVVAEGRQGYRAVLKTEPVPLLETVRDSSGFQVRWSAHHQDYALYEASSPGGPWTPVAATNPPAHGWRQHGSDVTNSVHLFRLQK